MVRLTIHELSTSHTNLIQNRWHLFKMKSGTKTYFAYFTLLVLMINCASQKTSIIVGGEYNETKNETGYFVIPYGSVTIPGNWTKTNYTSTSRQQFFQNSDSINIAIAFSRFDKYTFNSDGRHKGYDFIRSYYEWDSKYFVETHGLQRQEMETDSINRFMTYRIFGNIDKDEFDSYFLIGVKNGNITNISISDNEKWTEKEKLTFMKNLFISKKK